MDMTGKWKTQRALPFLLIVIVLEKVRICTGGAVVQFSFLPINIADIVLIGRCVLAWIPTIGSAPLTGEILVFACLITIVFHTEKRIRIMPFLADGYICFSWMQVVCFYKTGDMASGLFTIADFIAECLSACSAGAPNRVGVCLVPIPKCWGLRRGFGHLNQAYCHLHPSCCCQYQRKDSR